MTSVQGATTNGGGGGGFVGVLLILIVLSSWVSLLSLPFFFRRLLRRLDEIRNELRSRDSTKPRTERPIVGA